MSVVAVCIFLVFALCVVYIRRGNFNGNAIAGMIVPMEESDAFEGPMGTFFLFRLFLF